MDGVICLVGAPYRILTDQGPNFEGQLFKELCKALGIAKIRTSPYKPSTNGITERFHQTLNSMIAKCIKGSQRYWDLKVPVVLAAYRASCHSATSLTPNRIVFGRENTLPADLVLCDADKLPERENSVIELEAEHQERFRSAYQLARDHLKVVAQRSKSYYNVGVKSAEFANSRVWYFYPRRYSKRSRKWQFVYTGPYTVVDRLTDVTYLIKKGPQDKGTVVHVDKLKLCVEVPTCSKITVDTVVVSARPMEQVRNQCDRCGKIFTRPAGLRQHREAVHLQVTWPCQLCDEEQSSKSNLTSHYKRRHPNIRNLPEPRRGVREGQRMEVEVAISEKKDRETVSVRRLVTASTSAEVSES